MAAYVIVDVSITDHNEYEEYKKLTPAAIAAYDSFFCQISERERIGTCVCYPA